MNVATLALCLTAVVALSACASKTPYFDSRFGAAVTAAKAQQTINPNASSNRDPVAGIDGDAANSSMEEYQKSFRAPPPTFPVLTIGVR